MKQASPVFLGEKRDFFCVKQQKNERFPLSETVGQPMIPASYGTLKVPPVTA